MGRRSLLLTLACLFVVLASAVRADACSCTGNAETVKLAVITKLR